MAKSVNVAFPGVVLLIGVLLGMLLSRAFMKQKDGFTSMNLSEWSALAEKCGVCKNPRQRCGCNGGSGSGSGSGGSATRLICPPCPDLSAYVLKSTVPPCPSMPDLSKYMLKTECPPVPDLSSYILKASIPKPQPVILDCTKCNKPSGECPPCPRARCPTVMCPPPTKCPAPAPCPRQICPPTVVKCKAEDAPIQQVRPYLAPLSVTGFGMG